MEDPARAWPAWKFGMKRDDLFTTLHDQYNTFSYTLQDPEAFHHDVYEISHGADTVDDFHRMMAARREMRLRELHESLETLAVEIIANPKLMATEQWDTAVQLFRTKSYDSLVRYFASYIPGDYLDRHDTQNTHDTHSVTTNTSSCSSASSFSESDIFSTTTSCVDQGPLLFTDDDYFPESPIMTCEPDVIEDKGGRGHDSCEPLSPPSSEAAPSDTSASSPLSDVDFNDFSTSSPSCSTSFCGCSDGGHVVPDLIHQSYVETSCQTLQFDECDATFTSVCDAVSSRSMVERGKKHELSQHDMHDAISFVEDEDEDEDFPTTQYPDDELDSVDFFPDSCLQDTPDCDTSTPQPEALTASHMEFLYFKSKKALSPVRCRSSSPKSPLDGREIGTLSPPVRRSPDEASSRIQKSIQVSTIKKRRTAAKRD
ncbi:hypothetical protein E4U55_003249 [Claviceps digitariae]|nr:hypothetical protein E4U55_003249 [Claviceps digitariae]